MQCVVFGKATAPGDRFTVEVDPPGPGIWALQRYRVDSYCTEVPTDGGLAITEVFANGFEVTSRPGEMGHISSFIDWTGYHVGPLPLRVEGISREPAGGRYLRPKITVEFLEIHEPSWAPQPVDHEFRRDGVNLPCTIGMIVYPQSTFRVWTPLTPRFHGLSIDATFATEPTPVDARVIVQQILIHGGFNQQGTPLSSFSTEQIGPRQLGGVSSDVFSLRANGGVVPPLLPYRLLPDRCVTPGMVLSIAGYSPEPTGGRPIGIAASFYARP